MPGNCFTTQEKLCIIVIVVYYDQDSLFSSSIYDTDFYVFPDHALSTLTPVEYIQKKTHQLCLVVVFLQDGENTEEEDEDDDQNFMVTTLIVAGCVSGILLVSVCIFVILRRYCHHLFIFVIVICVVPPNKESSRVEMFPLCLRLQFWMKAHR